MHRINLYILCGFIALLSCNNSGSEQSKSINERNLNKPDQIIVKINVSFVDSNFTKAVLSADSGFAYSSTYKTVLKQHIRVDFYAKNSINKISTLTADSVVIDDDTKNMTAFGNVIVKSDSTHTSLETKLLRWDNKSRKLYTPEFVKITSPNEILQGYGFESDDKLSYYKIFKVTGVQR